MAAGKSLPTSLRFSERVTTGLDSFCWLVLGCVVSACSVACGIIAGLLQCFGLDRVVLKVFL